MLDSPASKTKSDVSNPEPESEEDPEETVGAGEYKWIGKGPDPKKKEDIKPEREIFFEDDDDRTIGIDYRAARRKHSYDQQQRIRNDDEDVTMKTPRKRQAQFCAKCGSQIPQGNTYCPRCGASMENYL